MYKKFICFLFNKLNWGFPLFFQMALAFVQTLLSRRNVGNLIIKSIEKLIEKKK